MSDIKDISISLNDSALYCDQSSTNIQNTLDKNSTSGNYKSHDSSLIFDRDSESIMSITRSNTKSIEERLKTAKTKRELLEAEVKQLKTSLDLQNSKVEELTAKVEAQTQLHETTSRTLEIEIESLKEELLEDQLKINERVDQLDIVTSKLDTATSNNEHRLNLVESSVSNIKNNFIKGTRGETAISELRARDCPNL